MPPGSAIADAFRENEAPSPSSLALLTVFGVAIVAGSAFLWPVGTTDYAVQMETTPVESPPQDEVIAYDDLPRGAQQAVDSELANPDSGLERYRTTAAEIRKLQQHRYVAYQGQYYPYELRHNHDMAPAAGRAGLIALGAVVLLLSGLVWTTERMRPLTAVTGALVPVLVALALAVTYAIELVAGGPGNTLPTPGSGPSYVLGLSVVLFVGTVAARTAVAFRWLPVSIFVFGVGFVMWEASTYIIEHGAPVYFWLIVTVVAALGLVGALLPVVGLGYLLAAPTDVPE